VGESAVDAVAREVAEESGITLEVTGIAGVYSDPTHVLVDPGGITHQQLAICFHAVPAPSVDGGPPRPDGIETDAAAWFDAAEVAGLRIHPAMRLRIDNALRAPGQPFVERASPQSERSRPTMAGQSVGVPEQRQSATY
jgi:ADP-ribose pyrophosphatase YjhB (NUDIX family)